MLPARQEALMLMPSVELDPYGVLASLFFKTKSSASPEGVLRILGFVHLYQAAGIHLLAFFSLTAKLIQWTGLRWEVKPQWIKRVSFVVCSVFAFWIWSLLGFSPSFLRPMSTFYLRSYFNLRGAAVRILLPLFFTFLIDGVVHGGDFFTFGATHYYLAVAGGLLALERSKNKSVMIMHIQMAVGSWLPIAVFDLVHDHLVSFMTPIHSLISIPIITMVLYPLTLLSILGWGSIPPFLCQIWNRFLELLLILPEQGFTFFVINEKALFWGFILSGIFVFLLGFLKNRKKILVFLPLFLTVLFLLKQNHHPSQPNRVVQVDVKQGDATLIQKMGRNEWVDFGSFRALRDESWLRKMSQYGVLRIEGALLSHLDEDHMGGLRHILPWTKLECVQINQKLLETLKGKVETSFIHEHFPHTRIQSQNCIQLSTVSWFQSKRSGAKGNETMAGIVHELNAKTAYFSLGDGDQEQERLFGLRYRAEILKYQRKIWKVGHHGSRFSSDPVFLNEINPEQLWISVGKKNRYHHPHPLVLLRLKKLSASIHRTDEEGDISVSATE